MKVVRRERKRGRVCEGGRRERNKNRRKGEEKGRKEEDPEKR